MGNFDFLLKNKNYKDFASACVDAEKSMIISTINAAAATRRALELAVKWVYRVDTDLTLPFRDNLSTLTRHKDFVDIIEPGLGDLIHYIIKLGNLATHTNKKIDKPKVVASLRNLFAFVDWVDYCYGDTYVQRTFDENLIPNLASAKVDIDPQEREKIKEEIDQQEDKSLQDQREDTPDQVQEDLLKNKHKENALAYTIDSRTEALTRKEFIDVDLELAGWTINDNALCEVKLKGMPNTSGRGAADYVLYGKDGLPLAVVEAKKTSVNPKAGAHQALLYTECLESEVGRRPFFFTTNGFYTEFRDDDGQRKVSGFYSQDDLERLMKRRDIGRPLSNYTIDRNITNRDYQISAINSALDAYNKKRRAALLVMATGTGKTRTAISIVDIMTRANQVKNILFLADRTALVTQAMRNFNALLPDLSIANLTDAKRSNKEDLKTSRMIFSTYQTMLNSIDTYKTKEGSRLFTVGHFDLIIIDEAHRSIYQRYKEIFDYFDAKILGLTATPRSDIDRNTYAIFNLEDDDPTYAYGYQEAVDNGYLVPYKTIEAKLKLPEEGIIYDKLSPEEKEEYNNLFPDGDHADIDGKALNQWLFNKQTVDIVLKHLMERGIPDSSGNELGKTIIFAKNQLHANFIKERFDLLFPEKEPDYAQVITYNVAYADNLIDRFSVKEKLPKLAISVNMLDTGIDIPEIVNLVFFKVLYSKVMFLQMIGRGTRLCKDLFGPGLDKKNFLIFDYGENFERFRQKKDEPNDILPESLSERLFYIKAQLVETLEETSYEEVRDEFVEELHKEILDLDQRSFRVRNILETVVKFSDVNAWSRLGKQDLGNLKRIAKVVNPPKSHELTQRFDIEMLSLALGLLEGNLNKKLVRNLMKTAKNLSQKRNIDQVRAKLPLLRAMQESIFWENLDFLRAEETRKNIRDLMPLIDPEVQEIYYSNFDDEITSFKESEGEDYGPDLKTYRERVEHYVRSQINDDEVLDKVYKNEHLDRDDISRLEQILFKYLGSKDDYKKEYGDMKILRLIRSITGLDMGSIQEAFADFYIDNQLNYAQTQFMDAIITYLNKNGYLSMEEFQKEPFKSIGSITKIFKENKKEMQALIGVIKEINANADVA